MREHSKTLKAFLLERRGVTLMENLPYGRLCAKAHIDCYRDAQTLSEPHYILHSATEGSRLPSDVCVGQIFLLRFLCYTASPLRSRNWTFPCADAHECFTDPFSAVGIEHGNDQSQGDSTRGISQLYPVTHVPRSVV